MRIPGATAPGGGRGGRSARGREGRKGGGWAKGRPRPPRQRFCAGATRQLLVISTPQLPPRSVRVRRSEVQVLCSRSGAAVELPFVLVPGCGREASAGPFSSACVEVGGLWNRTFWNDPQRPGMSNYVNDMWPGSPLQSPAASGGSSRLSSAARSRSSRSSRSRSSGSSRWSSGSRGSRPRRSSRSRSRSRSRRRQQRKYRRYSRSYSRSRSRSRSCRRRYRGRHCGSSRRHYRSPSPSPDRSRSRSRSRGRSYYRRAYAVTRGRRYYGFGRTVYPEDHGSWRGRSRSRSRSRSPTPFRLSEKDRMELLEIAKANAAKALGTTNFELPPSLRVVSVSKEANHGTAVSNNGAKFELSEKLREDGTKNANEKSSQQNISSNNSVAKTAEGSSGSLKINQKKSPYELWKPI